MMRRMADVTPSPEQAYVALARVVKTQGRHGELGARLLTDIPDRFAGLERVFLLGAQGAHRGFRLLRHWPHKGLVILQLEGIEDLNAAEPWVGAEVQLPIAERRLLAPEEYFVSDLEGCEVWAAGELVGRVQVLEEIPGATSLFHVLAPDGNEILIPFAAGFVRGVDVGAKRITMELPDGLLDVNRPAAPKAE